MSPPGWTLIAKNRSFNEMNRNLRPNDRSPWRRNEIRGEEEKRRTARKLETRLSSRSSSFSFMDPLQGMTRKKWSQFIERFTKASGGVPTEPPDLDANEPLPCQEVGQWRPDRLATLDRRMQPKKPVVRLKKRKNRLKLSMAQIICC